MKKYIIAVSSLLFALNAQSQSAWTLRQCIDYAIEHNIEIKQESLQVESAEISLNSSKNSRLPDLNVNVGQNFNFGRSVSQTTNEYETATTASTTWGATSSTSLFTGFRISNDIKSKELSLKAATEGLNKVKDNMQLQIASYYLDVLFKKEILKVYEEQVALTEKQVARTGILVESGKVAMSQLFDIKAQLAKDHLNVINSDNDLKNSLLSLSQVLNLDFDKNFDIVTPQISDAFLSDEALFGLMNPNEVFQQAVNVKPQVKEAQYNVESREKNVKVAKSGYWPTLNFQLGYNNAYSKKYNSGNPSFGDQINNNRGEYIALNLSIPIFDRFTTRNQVRQANIEVQSSKLTLDNVKLNLYKEIQQAYQNAVGAQAKFNSTVKAYDASNESFKYAEERYNIGKISVFEYNEAQTKLISSKSEQIQAKFDFVFRSKILDFYQGKEIDLLQ